MRIAPRTLSLRAHGPVALLLAGGATIAGFAASTGVQISYVALDETLHKQSAVNYTAGLPGSLFHDLAARATTRLYPLLISPLFELFDGDVAIRAAKVVSAVMLASAAIPVYLLARRVIASRWLAALAGLASIAVPWLVLSTTLFTESLAYPAFLWATLAIVSAIASPSPRRDLLAVAAIGLATVSRTQMFVVFVAYALLIGLGQAQLLRRQGPAVWRRVGAPRLREFPFSTGIVVIACLVVVALLADGSLGARLARVLGAYGEIQHRANVTPDASLGLLFEFVALSIGVGLLPAMLGAAWYGSALTARAREEIWRFASSVLVIASVLVLGTLYAQGGFLGAISEERYYFYVVPLIWIGALAALEQPRLVRRSGVGMAGGLLVVALGAVPLTVPLTHETAFLAPVAASVAHFMPPLLEDLGTTTGLVGITLRDGLAILALVAMLAAVVVWDRSRRALAGLVVLAAAAQCGLTAYVFSAAGGGVDGVPARTGASFAGLGWIDRALSEGQIAAWVDNQSRFSDTFVAMQRDTVFWNDQLRQLVRLPASGLPAASVPLYTLSMLDVVADPATGELDRSDGFDHVAQSAASPLFQLAGSRLAMAPDGYVELVRLEQPYRARWNATGLSPEGWVLEGAPVRILAAAPDRVAQAFRVALTFTGPDQPTAVTVRIGRATRTLSFAVAGQAHVARFDVCGSAAIKGELVTLQAAVLPDGRRVGASLRNVVATGLSGSRAQAACKRVAGA